MVNLPPSLDELNEFARLAFVHEMHSLAAQILDYVLEPPELVEKIDIAVQVIEAEWNEVRDRFQDTAYQRPDSKHVTDLILRCAELYLDRGMWFDLCHANLRIREKNIECSREEIKGIFHSTGLTDRFAISSPIIELTLTRLEMMAFFNEADDGTNDHMLYEIDPLSSYHLTSVKPLLSAVELMNRAEVPEHDLDALMISDEDYLEKREEFTWSVYRDLRFPGSVFCSVYFIILAALTLNELVHSSREFPIPEALFLGYSGAMLLVELFSFRICLIACCRPNTTIPCIYPGVDYYIVQLMAELIGTVGVTISIPCDKFESSVMIMGFCLHQIVSLLAALLCIPCFFKSHARVERKFTWIRASFFNSPAWRLVQAIYFLLFTPGLYVMQMLIAYRIRNRPEVSAIAAPPTFLETI
jgi:hypothetical protein